MRELTCNVPIPSNPQELEQAIQQYLSSPLSGTELFCQWQAIRDACLNQETPEPENDKVPGEHSY